LRSWFTGPPRAHGEVLEDRAVSFLELFYDLVFVVLIAQIAHTFAGDVSWGGFVRFAVVFCLVWVAWVNGSFYHELHGREDGRSRAYIFVQMAMLVIMAVYAAHAADDVANGRNFAIVYALLLAFIEWQWYSVRTYDTDEMASSTMRYNTAMMAAIAIIVISAFVNDPDIRLALWASTVVIKIASSLSQVLRPDPHLEEALRITDSMAERFGLFTIIVLGEVVVGVVEGLSEADHNARTVATGVVALVIGFGFWWNYFDFVGKRAPRPGSHNRGVWNLGHLPMWLAVAAAGAGMVNLVEHAGDNRTPANTAWLIAGATAAMAAALAAITLTMPTHPGRRLVPITLSAAAVIALILGALRPSPLTLASALAITLAAVWIEALVRHAHEGTPIGQL
jgi:low temperature requirement protein LtrA